MELQFETTPVRCLGQRVREICRREQSQEVRLQDGFPDIGRVICAWGQIILRSKQWQGNAMQASGGVMARILYAPEDGSGCRSVETWVPVQGKWEFPATEREGIMSIQPLLCQIDARTVSPRKMIVRACTAMLGQVWEPEELHISRPEQVPEGVELLTNTYPVTMIREAGEKLFSLEEDLRPTGPAIHQLLRCELFPQVLEKKVLSGKLMFRGIALVQMLYEDESGKLNVWKEELQFAQLAELEETFSEAAKAELIPVVTNLEISPEEDGSLHFGGSVVVQYTISDVTALELPEDAYSPVKNVTPQLEELDFPYILDDTQPQTQLQGSCACDAAAVEDVAYRPDFPRQTRCEDGTEIEVPGTMSVLVTTDRGTLEAVSLPCESRLHLTTDEKTETKIAIRPGAHPWAELNGGQLQIFAESELTLRTQALSGMTMLTGLTVEEGQKCTGERPTLVLRRYEEESLWELAKRCGSTVGAIRQANHLQQEPMNGQMLLIPVI